jgi:hypothetical protein
LRKLAANAIRGRMGDHCSDRGALRVCLHEFHLFYLQRLEPETLGLRFNPRRFMSRRLVDPGFAVFRFAPQGHGDINVLEDAARGNAENTIGGFDEVVASASAVLAAEVVDEAETGAELFGFD